MSPFPTWNCTGRVRMTVPWFSFISRALAERDDTFGRCYGADSDCAKIAISMDCVISGRLSVLQRCRPELPSPGLTGQVMDTAGRVSIYFQKPKHHRTVKSQPNCSRIECRPEQVAQEYNHCMKAEPI
ncbi:uncharacterized protein [Chiloscyllium punctatum]|uniref:uncharacterized protein isoform X2 n=1 Tax=Chiloscyllium punctatum TaxID=137246 RepID=UPI003B6409BA